MVRSIRETPLRWTCKSLCRLAAKLRAQGMRLAKVIGKLLEGLKFSLQGKRKTQRTMRTGSIVSLPRRLRTAASDLGRHQEKELVGELKIAGRGPRLSHQREVPYGPSGVCGANDSALVAGGRGWRYREAKRLVITADGAGSNGFRLRLWKRELQRLANELSIELAVSHFPPGTSVETDRASPCSRSSVRTGVPSRSLAIA